MNKLLRKRAVLAGYFLAISYLPVYITIQLVKSTLEEGDSDMAAGFFILGSMIYSPFIVIISTMVIVALRRRYVHNAQDDLHLYLYGLFGSLVSLLVLTYLVYK